MSVPLFKLSVSISKERLIDSKLVSLEIGVRASDIVEVHDQEMKGSPHSTMITIIGTSRNYTLLVS